MRPSIQKKREKRIRRAQEQRAHDALRAVEKAFAEHNAAVAEAMADLGKMAAEFTAVAADALTEVLAEASR